MPRMQSDRFATFNDGILDICIVENRTITQTKHRGLRFGKKTVGINRFWQAQVSSATVDALVAILPVEGITTMDVCVLHGKQYKILQVQEIFDGSPPHLLLSLERIQISYKDVRE